MPPITDLGRWRAALLLGLVLILLLLIAAWLLRTVVPVAPALTLSVMETPAAGRAARMADPMPTLRTSLDDARANERKLKAELAARQDDLRKQMERCKPAQPSLPAERWSKGDLATLKGCWVLRPRRAHDAQLRRRQAGTGHHRGRQDLLRRPWWRPARAGHDRPDGKMGLQGADDGEILEQRNAGHEPARRHLRRRAAVRWAATQLTCQRVNDEMALCQAVDKSGRTQVEFRREP